MSKKSSGADASEVKPSQLASAANAEEGGPQAAAAQAVRREAEPVEGPEEVTLSNGTKVLIVPVSPFMMNAAMQAIKRPDVPVNKIDREDGESWEEENPLDPAYLVAKDEYNAKCIQAVTDLFVAAGLQIIELGPAVMPFEDDGWQALPKRFGVEISDDEYERKIQWVKLHVIGSAADVDKTITKVSSKSGLGEAEVMASIAAFQRRTARRVGDGDTGAKAGDGDHVPGAVSGNGLTH